MFVDHSRCKLGKLPPVADRLVPMLSAYVSLSLPSPPARLDRCKGVAQWPMYDNDKIGDCTVAGAAHLIEVWDDWTDGASDRPLPTDAAVLAAYEKVSGYRPGQPGTDNGARLVDVLQFWRSTGIDGHKIDAWAGLERGSRAEVEDAIWLFGGAYVGLELPVSAQRQIVWSVPSGSGDAGVPGSWGGHCVPIVGYDHRGLTCVTWGALKRMTWGFYARYCDEAYAVLSAGDWTKNGETRDKVDIDMLKKDLAEL